MTPLPTSERSVGPRGRMTGLLALVLAPALALMLGACDIDEILSVDLPGDVTEADLNDPALANTLALGVQADFECGLVDYIWYPGLWFSNFTNSSTSRPNALMELRAQLIDVYADPCASGTGPVYGPIMTPRLTAVRATNIINSYETPPANKEELLGGIALYQGYAEQLMGESHCGVVILDPVAYPDGGPLGTRAAAWERAVALFGTAISKGTADVKSAAYVGRARANLNLGNMAAAIADAALVPEGFQMEATYSESPYRRVNKIASRNIEGTSLLPHRDWLGKTIKADGTLTKDDGTADPRVKIIAGEEFGGRGLIDMRHQQKYLKRDDPIPFATWREAQLIIAEASQGATAVEKINLLRSNSAGLAKNIDSTAWPLTAYAGGTSAAEVTELVREERRRELWYQGVRPGDKIRWGEAFEMTSEYGTALGAGGPLMTSFLEVASNDLVTQKCP